MRWIAEELGPETYVNVMAQYYPAGKATNTEHAEINRAITREEFRGVLAAAREAGLLRTDQRSALRVLR
ncbi:MAG TPA: hypothetical protein VLE48_06425 [Terriglobales bacterium]|nr:hypothetical protein [Terriglobales bacterium]